MKLLKWLLFIFLLITSSEATTIKNEYNEPLLEQHVLFPEHIKNLENIQEYLLEKYNYKLRYIVSDYEFDTKQTLSYINNFPNLRMLLIRVFEPNDVKVVEEKDRGFIFVKKLSSFSLKLTDGWDGKVIMETLEKNFPNSIFKFKNGKIIAYDTKDNLKYIKEVFEELEDLDKKLLNIHFDIQRFASGKTPVKEGTYLMNFDVPDFKTYEVFSGTLKRIKHNYPQVIMFEGKEIAITMDLLKNEMTFDHTHTIPLKDLVSVGYVFQMKNPKEPTKKENYLLSIRSY